MLSRLRALGVVALLTTLSVLAPAPATAQAPDVVVEPSAGDLSTPFTFRLPAELRVGTEALENAGFDAGGEAWRARGEAVPTFEDGAARLTLASARAPGVSTLEQEFAVDAAAFEVTVRAAATGSFAGFSVLLRETGGAETVFDARPDAEPRELRWLWHPADASAGARATIVVAVRFAGGDSADVTLHEVRVTPVSDVAWDFGDGTPPTHGFEVRHRFAAPGAHPVVATLRHPGEPPRSSTTEVVVENLAPIANATATRIGTSARFLLDASASGDPDGVETRIRNAAFSDGTSGWELATGEVQAPGALAVQDGSLRLTTEPAGVPGTAFAWQAVPIVPARAYRFDVTARDDGTIARYVFLLRETGSASGVHDHVLEHAPVGANWTRMGFTFEPRYNDSTSVIVHLRVALADGARADVAFDDVSLRDGLRFAWSIDGRPLASRQAITEVALTGGEHVVLLNVTDVAGATATARLTLNATLAGGQPVAGIAPPLFALQDQAAVFRGAPSRPGEGVEMLVDTTFERDAATWRVTAPAEARVRFANATATMVPDPATTFPAELSQRVPIDASQTYELHLRHLGNVNTAQAIIHELRVDTDGRARLLAETVEPIPNAAAAWRDFRLRWSATDARATHVDVMVRAVGEGALEVRDPSFAPLKRYAWQFDVTPTSHTAVEGYGVRHLFPRTGLSLVTLQVEDPATGRRNGTSVLVPVLNASGFEARANLGGGVHLSWPRMHAPASWSHFEVERRDRATNATTALRIPLAPSISFTDGDAPPGRDLVYDMYIVGVNGTRALAASANVTLATGAPRGAIDAPETVRRFDIVEVEVAAPFDAARVEGRLSWGPLPMGRLQFAEDARTPGTWRATYTPGFFTPPVPLTLRVDAVDETGARTPLATETTIHVELLGAGWTGILLVLGALALPLGAWGVRRLRAREHLQWMNEPPAVEEDA